MTNTKKWEKEFYQLVKEYGTNWEDWICLEEQMKTFISSLLLQTQLETLEWCDKEVAKMKLVEKYPLERFEIEGWERTKKYNLALSDVCQTIKNKMEEIKEKI